MPRPALLLFALAACTGAPPAPSTPAEPTPTPKPVELADSTPAAPKLTAGGHLLNRWVAYTAAGDCDALLVSFREQVAQAIDQPDLLLEGWTARPAFAGGPDDAWPGADGERDGPDAFPLPAELSRYCALEGPLPASVHDRLAAVADGGALDEVASAERAVVSPLAVSGALGAHAAGKLHRKTGWADPGCAADRAARVEVVFLDNAATSATGGQVPSSTTPAAFLADDAMPSEHGFGLAALSRSLLCGPIDAPTNACVADVRTRIALPRRWTATGMEWSVGSDGQLTHGEVGTRVDLAQAIRRAVRRWQGDGASTRLVLNLSVGWAPEVEDAIGATWRENTLDRQRQPGAAMVYDALRQAQCSGALIVAAAGNTINGAGDDRPLLPAAWAAGPPRGVEGGCPSAGADRTAPPADAPLLYAVGGITGDGLPLSVSRDNSAPTLQAYGVEGTAVLIAANPDAGAAGLAIDPMTGTSVSSAVVASAAAAFWASSPSLGAHDVMTGLVGASGQSLPAESVDDYWTGAWLDTPQAVGLCRKGEQTCCLIPDGDAPPAPKIRTGAVIAVVTPTSGGAGTAPPATGARGTQTGSAPALEGVVFPQPIIVGCPTCFVFEPDPAITSDGTLYLDFSSSYRNVVVEVRLSGGAVKQYPINSGGLVTAGPKTFTLSNVGGEITNAVLQVRTTTFPRQTVTQDLKVLTP